MATYLIFCTYVVLIGVIVTLAIMCHTTRVAHDDLLKRFSGVENNQQRLELIMSKFIHAVKEQYDRSEFKIASNHMDVMKKLVIVDDHIIQNSKEIKDDILSVDDAMTFIGESAKSMADDMQALTERLNRPYIGAVEAEEDIDD